MDIQTPEVIAMNIHASRVQPMPVKEPSTIEQLHRQYEKARDKLQSADEADTATYDRCIEAVGDAERTIINYRCVDMIEVQQKAAVLIRMYASLGDADSNLGCYGLAILQSLVPLESVHVNPQERVSTLFEVADRTNTMVHVLERQTHGMDDEAFSRWSDETLSAAN